MAQPGICWGDEKSKLLAVSDYRYTTGKCLFRDKVNEKFIQFNKDTSDTSLFGVDDPICRYIRGFSVPDGLPWYLVDEVFIPVNIMEKIHWILAMVNLKHRSIIIYDSMAKSSVLHWAGVHSVISKWACILPHYIQLSEFLDHNERHVWKQVDAYRDKTPNDLFSVLYQECIPQQRSGSLDCDGCCCICRNAGQLSSHCITSKD